MFLYSPCSCHSRHLSHSRRHTVRLAAARRAVEQEACAQAQRCCRHQRRVLHWQDERLVKCSLHLFETAHVRPARSLQQKTRNVKHIAAETRWTLEYLHSAVWDLGTDCVETQADMMPHTVSHSIPTFLTYQPLLIHHIPKQGSPAYSMAQVHSLHHQRSPGQGLSFGTSVATEVCGI